MPVIVLLLLSACTTVERVQQAVTSVTNSVTPIRTAPPPVRSPLYYICDANQTSRTWECRTTRTSDGAVVDDPMADATAGTQPADLASSAAATAQGIPDRAPDPAPRRQSIPQNSSAEAGSAAMSMNAAADTWAVQLIALNDEAALHQYATNLGLSAPIYAQTRAGSESLFVLLLGIYPDRDTADAARAAFMVNAPIEVSPWVRPLAPLQQAVRAVHPD